MPDQLNPAPAPLSALFGPQGELVHLRIAVDPRLLEDLLETLASLDFPLNPALFHQPGVVLVDFPAWRDHLPAIRDRLRSAGFDSDAVRICEILLSRSAAAAG